MKNKEIIADAAVRAGILADEEAKDAFERGKDIPLHTLQGWNMRGNYRLREGEEGIEVKLWKKKEGKNKFYLVKSYLYRLEQMETI